MQERSCECSVEVSRKNGHGFSRKTIQVKTKPCKNEAIESPKLRRGNGFLYMCEDCLWDCIKKFPHSDYEREEGRLKYELIGSLSEAHPRVRAFVRKMEARDLKRLIERRKEREDY